MIVQKEKAEEHKRLSDELSLETQTVTYDHKLRIPLSHEK